MSDLLPINASSLEKKISEATAIHDLAVPLATLWGAHTCPDNTLPQLAWGFSVDFWDNNWADEDKRRTIAESYQIHAKKGTPASIRLVMRNAGFGEVEIVESLDADKYNGQHTHSGSHFYGGDKQQWAKYSIYIKQPITIAQATDIRKMLVKTAPARCHLTGLHYDQAQHSYNSQITYNGTYAHGVA